MDSLLSQLYHYFYYKNLGMTKFKYVNELSIIKKIHNSDKKLRNQ